jgi:hypothetical protein
MIMNEHEMALFSKHIDTDCGCDCWEWTGSRNKQGYGQFKYRNTTQLAHRLSWMNYFGTTEADVLHKCGNTFCVNPNHLYLGSDSDNQRDIYKEGRRFRKLTLDEVKQIKRTIHKYTNRELAEAFGCSHTHISSIRNGHKWAWVEAE